MKTMTVLLPRPFVLAALASLFTLAFVFSPYWILPGQPIPAAALLVGILALGTIWALCSASAVKVELRPGNVVTAAALCLGVFLLNLAPLTSGLPWRGDEDYHVFRTLETLQRTPLYWILSFAVLAILMLFAVWRRSKWALVAGAGLLAVAILFGWRGGAFSASDAWILRYPFLNYWVFMLVPGLAAPVAGAYHEILYRVVPLLAMCAVAWTFQRRVANPSAPIAFLWGLAIATVPVIYYYSSILYLEPAAVALMFVVCLDIKDLLQADPQQIRGLPAWYALILIGFVKETTLAFLLAFVLCRLIYQLRNRPLRQLLTGEARIVIATCLPIGLYFVLRSTLAHVRGFEAVPAALANGQVYRALAQSYLEQFGLLLIPFAIGCLLLARRKDYFPLLFFGLVAVLLPLLYTMDKDGIYAGYSRFNLLALPAILAGASIGIVEAAPKLRRLAAFAPAALIAANLLMSPVHADGTKVPYWGNYLFDTSEHYYPFREALYWLQSSAANDSILYAGWGYRYVFDFYFKQLAWQPRFGELGTEVTTSSDRWGMHFSRAEWAPHRNVIELLDRGQMEGEAARATRVLRTAADGGYQAVVFQVLGQEIPLVQDTGEYRLEKVFRNQAHSVMVFVRGE